MPELPSPEPCPAYAPSQDEGTPAVPEQPTPDSQRPERDDAIEEGFYCTFQIGPKSTGGFGITISNSLEVLSLSAANAELGMAVGSRIQMVNGFDMSTKQDVVNVLSKLPTGAFADFTMSSNDVTTSELSQRIPAAAMPPFIPTEFYDVISGDIMTDPVMARDGHSYSRVTITAWFAQCRQQGMPLSSPLTREVVESEELRPNIALKKTIEEYLTHLVRTQVSSHEEDEQRTEVVATALTAANSTASTTASTAPAAEPATASVHGLGRIFEHLDPLRQILAETLNGWQPPQLVVVGNEKAGKSTLLERLCLMSMFPHSEEICTRMRIEVRLRRAPIATVPRLDMYNLRESRLEFSRLISCDGGAVDVRQAMEAVIQQHSGGLRGVSKDFKIILHVQSPNVPSLDLVDLPGVVTAASPGEPEDMPQQTRELVEEHILQSKAHSLFLCVVPATMAPNASTGMQLLQQLGVLDRTIGVITMCDELAARHHPKLRARLQQEGDAVVLEPFGWVATMNRAVTVDEGAAAPTEGASSSCHYAALVQQAEAEVPFFLSQDMGDLVDAGVAGCPALMQSIDAMFLSYMRESWFPATMRKLHDEQANLIAQNEALGLPATTATVVDGACVPTAAADLQEIRGLAVATACEALERHIQWMSNYYWRVLIIDLSERLDQVLATAATTAVPVFHVPAWIKDLQASLLGACTEAQRLNRQIWPNLVHTVLHDLPPTHEKQRQRHQQQAAAQQQQQASTPSRSFRGSLSKKHSSGGRGGASPQETSPAAGEVAEVELGVRVGNWGLGIRVGKKEIGSPVPEGPTLGPMGGGLSNLANSFKLTRFPAAINAIVEQARRLTDECATELATELERCIEQHIRSTRSPSLQVNYQQYLTEAAGGESTERRRLKTATAATEATTAAGLPENPVENPLAMREDLSTCQLQGSGGGDTTWKPVRVTLKLDCEHIKNDILHLFVRQGSLLIGGGPLIHGGDSPGLVSMLTDVIPQFITETTQETVYVQRAHLNGRLQQVYRAIQSLTTTFGTPTDRPTALPSAASTRGGQQQQQGGGAVPAVVGGGAVRGVPTRLEDLQTGDSVDYKTKQRIWKRVRVLSVIAVDASRIMVTIERSDGRPKSFDIVKTAEVAASIAQDSPLPVSTFKSDKLRLPRKD